MISLNTIKEFFQYKNFKMQMTSDILADKFHILAKTCGYLKKTLFIPISECNQFFKHLIF